MTYSTWRDTEEKRKYDMLYDTFHNIVNLVTEKIGESKKLVGIFRNLELEWDNDDEGCLKYMSPTHRQRMMKVK